MISSTSQSTAVVLPIRVERARQLDAADRTAVYGIDWSPDRIDWTVNGETVFTAVADIPQVPMRLFANIWAADPSIARWAGQTAPGTTAQANIQMLTHRPYPETLQN